MQPKVTNFNLILKAGYFGTLLQSMVKLIQPNITRGGFLVHIFGVHLENKQIGVFMQLPQINKESRIGLKLQFST